MARINQGFYLEPVSFFINDVNHTLSRSNGNKTLLWQLHWKQNRIEKVQFSLFSFSTKLRFVFITWLEIFSSIEWMLFTMKWLFPEDVIRLKTMNSVISGYESTQNLFTIYYCLLNCLYRWLKANHAHWIKYYSVWFLQKKAIRKKRHAKSLSQSHVTFWVEHYVKTAFFRK